MLYSLFISAYMAQYECTYVCATPRNQHHTSMDFHIWWLRSYQQCFPNVGH